MCKQSACVAKLPLVPITHLLQLVVPITHVVPWYSGLESGFAAQLALTKWDVEGNGTPLACMRLLRCLPMPHTCVAPPPAGPDSRDLGRRSAAEVPARSQGSAGVRADNPRSMECTSCTSRLSREQRNGKTGSVSLVSARSKLVNCLRH